MQKSGAEDHVQRSRVACEVQRPHDDARREPLLEPPVAFEVAHEGDAPEREEPLPGVQAVGGERLERHGREPNDGVEK